VYFVNEQIDAGDLCGQRSFPILPLDSLDSLLRRSKAEAAALTVEVLKAIETGTAERRPLDLTSGLFLARCGGRQAIPDGRTPLVVSP
jgi:methionyl-tRNA formyltransferase